jgi:signal transduction histidine kinase
MGSSLGGSDRELRLLVEEQASLRRVATLVARAVPPAEVFEAVCDEVARLLNAPFTGLLRYEPDGTATVLACGGDLRDDPAVGTRVRLDEVGGATVRGSVVVDGRPWGVMAAAWKESGRPPAGAEGRLAQFTELVGAAIANAESRVELSTSRTRVIAAADEARRRIERDLHDGTQQRLVSLALDLRAATASVPPELVELRSQLVETTEGLGAALNDLQEIARGIHPAILSRGGLEAALRTLARWSPVPVQLHISLDGRLPESLEVAIYYSVSEALTNVAKHAQASGVRVDLEAGRAMARLKVDDDGIGGASPSLGSGLIGLLDRIEALGGTIDIASPKGSGTTLLVEIPVGG